MTNQPMKIDEAIFRIQDHMRVHRLNEPQACYINIALETALEALRDQQEQQGKRGQWIITDYEYFDCSVCGEAYYSGADSTKQAEHWLINGDAYSFCPHCGADMRKEDA